MSGPGLATPVPSATSPEPGARLRYKAFISYSHAADARLAPVLQSALRRIGKAWYRLPPFRIFRDKVGLSANPDLWSSIEEALGQSEYFLLLASPPAAASEWVTRELTWWLQHKTVQSILIVVTDGAVQWGADDIDWTTTTALNRCLAGKYPGPPLYVDLTWTKTENHLSLHHARFRSAVLDIAPELYGLNRDQLDDIDVHASRSARRAATLAIALLTLLSAATTIASYRDVRASHEATRQRDTAVRQRNIAVCRGLAVAAAGQLDHRLDRALLLGTEASRLPDCVEGRSALLNGLQRAPKVSAFLSGHPELVTHVAYSPDGRLLASSGWGETVRVWDTKTWQALPRVLRGTYGVSFSPRGDLLAASTGNTIASWQVSDWQPRAELKLDEVDSDMALFSPDGRTLATNADPNPVTRAHVTLWDLVEQRPVVPALPGRTLAFSPDGRTLAASGEEWNEVRLLDAQGHATGPILGTHGGPVRCLAFSPDGNWLASGAEDDSLVLWDVRRRREVARWRSAHGGRVNVVAFNAQGTILASAGGGGSILLWNVETLESIEKLPTGGSGAVNGPVFGLSFSPDGRTLVSTTGDDRIIVWNLTDERALRRVLPTPKLGSTTLALSPDGRALAVGDEYDSLLLIDATTGETLATSQEEGKFTAAAFSHDGTELAAVSWEGTIALLDPRSLAAHGATVRTDRRMFSVAFSPDDKTLGVGGDSLVAFYDVTTRKPQRSPDEDVRDRVWSIAFSPDGNLVAAAGNESLSLYHARDGSLAMERLKRPVQGLMSTGVAFSPDGRWLAFRDGQKGVTLWDVAARRPSETILGGYESLVSSIAFSPDGRRLAASGGYDGVVLWDLATRTRIGRPLIEGETSALVFGRDGKSVIALGDKKVVRWNLDEDAWRTAACRIANRALTPSEWAEAFPEEPYRKTCPPDAR